MNKIIIIGNLTGDPEKRSTQSGKQVTTFTVACNRRGENAGADFFRVAAWDKMGETCAQYLAKGRKVCVGITPAHAGKRALVRWLVGCGGDHPRPCGEKQFRACNIVS